MKATKYTIKSSQAYKYGGDKALFLAIVEAESARKDLEGTVEELTATYFSWISPRTVRSYLVFFKSEGLDLHKPICTKAGKKGVLFPKKAMAKAAKKTSGDFRKDLQKNVQLSEEFSENHDYPSSTIFKYIYKYIYLNIYLAENFSAGQKPDKNSLLFQKLIEGIYQIAGGRETKKLSREKLAKALCPIIGKNKWAPEEFQELLSWMKTNSFFAGQLLKPWLLTVKSGGNFSRLEEAMTQFRAQKNRTKEYASERPKKLTGTQQAAILAQRLAEKEKSIDVDFRDVSGDNPNNDQFVIPDCIP
jgi:hypothetical protein